MMYGTATVEHADASEVAPSHHCFIRYRQRMRVRTPGSTTVEQELLAHISDADISSWPPAWVSDSGDADLWAVTGDLAFPLKRTGSPGRYLALTCLRRGI